MINFFRKKRKKLADENKTLKYARYAFGEIALVVVGILIALQLNTWKEYKKQSDLGYKYLTEMRQEVQSDVFMLAGYIQGLTKNIKNHEAALGTKDITKLPLDSLRMTVNPKNLDFKISELTSDKMKNMGLTSLSNNDELNTQITNYYNKEVVSLKLSLDWVFEALKKYMDYFNYQQDAIDIRFVGLKEYEFSSLYTQPKEVLAETNRKNMIQFILSPKGRNLILNDLENKRYSLRVLKSFQSSTESLLTSIYMELKKQDVEIEDLPILPSEVDFKEIKVSNEILKKYVGEYLSETDVIVNVVKEENRLYIKFPDWYNLEIFPYEEDKFFLKDYFAQIHFNKEKEEIVSVTFIRNGETEFKKVH